MPTYSFLCPKCGESSEKQLKITEVDNEESWPLCSCGERQQRAWITPEGGFILKGTGWFKKGGY